MTESPCDVPEEKLWLVDAHDAPTGDGWQWRSSNGSDRRNFRVINAFIRNAKGQLWIPRRTATKRMYPSCLDVSVGGHVEYDESYEESFYREAMEEIGVDISTISPRFLGYLNPHEHQLSAWMKVWEIPLESVPPYNPDDFSEWYWLTPGEFRERLRNGDRAKSDLPKLIDLFYPTIA